MLLEQALKEFVQISGACGFRDWINNQGSPFVERTMLLLVI